MDRNPNALKPRRPPRLAQSLIGLLCHRNTRDAVLGDLAEEFATRASESRRRAWFWYWGQVVRSCHHLLYARLRENRHRSVLFGLLIILLGTVFMLAWDILVSRNSARLVATWETPPTLTVIRAVYFFVLSIGAAICGTLVAGMTFSRQRTFWRNATLYLAPIFLVLAGVAMIGAAERGLAASSTYLLMRAGSIALAMLLAAAIIFRQKARR